MNRIVLLYLTGRYTYGDRDTDRGLLVSKTNDGIEIQDNEYGMNRRFYPMDRIQKMVYKNSWSD